MLNISVGVTVSVCLLGIMTEEQKVVRKMKNTDKHNQAAAAQHEAAGGISHPLLSPNSNNQPDPR